VWEWDPSTESRRDLGVLLALLHDADASFSTAQVTWRIWRNERRQRDAFIADVEERRRRGASISLHSYGRDTEEHVEREETVRIWRAGDRTRVEHHGGQRDGFYAVADGELWWMWDERTGGQSNEDDPSVGSNVAQELRVMLDPTPLLSVVRLRVAGRSDVAGRPTITAHASPRPPDIHLGRSPSLHELGTGADDYELQVDEQRGVLLAATALRGGRPFHAISAQTIAFDQPIPETTFRFSVPEGEEIHTRTRGSRLRHVTLTEAQHQAPFTVLMPDRVPGTWQVECTLLQGSQRPPSPPQVSLSYRSDDGHESVSISQLAVTDRASHHYQTMIHDDDWQTIRSEHTLIHVRPSGWGQAQAYLERDGTFAFLVSDNLTNDQLGTIASGLRPAPSTGSI
jgi:hypothetical protein